MIFILEGYGENNCFEYVEVLIIVLDISIYVDCILK